MIVTCPDGVECRASDYPCEPGKCLVEERSKTTDITMTRRMLEAGRRALDGTHVWSDGNMCDQDLVNIFRAMVDAWSSGEEKPSLKDDPRYEKVKELVAENPPSAGVRAVIPRRIWLEAGFTDEEIDERHSLGRNLR